MAKLNDNFIIENKSKEDFFLNVRNTSSHGAFFSMDLLSGDTVTVLKDDNSYLTVVNMKILEIAHGGFTTKDNKLTITDDWWIKKKMPIGNINQ